jgi:hypothetical protein
MERGYNLRVGVLVDTMLAAVARRRAPLLGNCLACGQPVRERSDAVQVRAGAYAHRECATYRTRQAERA